MRQAAAFSSICGLVSLDSLDLIEARGYNGLQRLYHADDLILTNDWIPEKLMNTQTWKERNTMATV